MKRIARVAGPAVLLILTACDKIPFIGKKAEPPADTAQVAAAPAVDTMAAAVPAEPPPAAAGPLVDEPWTPVDTGTVNPGMTREDVITVWGVPVAERTSGVWTFLYFRNGCEVSCGTFDVVMLQNGQVVDAVVRGPGHVYSGVSSSPPGRPAERTVPAVPGPTGAAG
ncbi:MAG: hypothetical protein HY337_11980 [Gemmatimonadetes bacterium]|nr:hypothetical protein [Gemmatimonadota bacterium]